MKVEMLVRRVVDGRVQVSVEMVDTYDPQRKTRSSVEESGCGVSVTSSSVERGSYRIPRSP